MNKELEQKLLDKPTLLGYRNLVKAIMKCDEEVKDEINSKYNTVISSPD